MSNPQLKELMRTLEESVESITSSQSYKSYLKLLSRFSSYSINNTLLIFQQMPQATMVAGFQTWQKQFGRCVKKGERGIRILAPVSWKVEEEDPKTGQSEVKVKTGFRSVCVFDYSQTKGRPIPMLENTKPVLGECSFFPQACQLLSRLTGYEVILVDHETAMGRCSYPDRKIFISASLSSLHAFKTLVHESAHALLHSGQFAQSALSETEKQICSSRPLREMEAESVSFLVCSSLGLDCSQYSFSYIAAWKQDTTFLPRSLQRITSTAAKILEVFPEECKPQYADASSPDQTEHPAISPASSRRSVPAVLYAL